MSAETAIQTALYTALTSEGLTVYDVAPQNADGGDAGVFPYVTVGTVTVVQWDTKEQNGFDFAARIHTRSRTGSMKQTKDIQGQIYDALHNVALPVTGYVLTMMQFNDSSCSRVSDGSFHGVSEFRGLIEKAEIIPQGPGFDSGYSIGFG